MRIRAVVTAVSGALALSALAVPSAQAAPTPDVTFSEMEVNGGKSVAVGVVSKVSVPVTYKLTYSGGFNVTYDPTYPFIYYGPVEDPVVSVSTGKAATCTATSSTTADCQAVIEIDPTRELMNTDARTWKAGAWAHQLNLGQKSQYDLDTVRIKRYARLSTNATPEPVAQGATITVTGALTRADWDHDTYGGYANQSVKLQFKKLGETTYTNVQTVTSGSGGALSTTVAATVDGYFRYAFAGTTTTASKKATGDFVDVLQ